MYHRWYGILIQKTKSKKQCENRSSKTCAVNSCSYNKTKNNKSSEFNSNNNRFPT